MKLPRGSQLIVASHNPGKVREIKALLGPHGIEPLSAADLGLAEPEETGSTFIANAELKARAAADAGHHPALADDSGLWVDALGGDPGIYSARWAGESKDFGAAMARVNDLLTQKGCVRPDQRKAHFVSALAVAWPDGHTETFEDRIDGEIVWPPRGEAGFGYDPFFLPEHMTRTFGEMSSQEKHGIPADGSRALSHRARAFQALMVACLKTSS